MRAYRWSLNVKLGLVLFAVAIALASLVYTHSVVEKLRTREAFLIELWAGAQKELAMAQSQSQNPHTEALQALEAFLAGDDARQHAGFLDAVRWAQTMPPPAEVNFITERILRPNLFGIPAIVTTEGGTPVIWRNLPIDSTLIGASSDDSVRILSKLEVFKREMDAVHAPVPIEISFPGPPPMELRQALHYGESDLVRALRLFPYVQLGFVGLFVLLGYVSFSYVRRSEQRSLWVGMAKEAAHQLGTPLSSLMGWNELMRDTELSPLQQEAVRETDRDIERLRRVASRFSDIGSVPRLEVQPVAPIVENVATYVRRRMPQLGRPVALTVNVDPALRARINAELFEWVVENLLKNALDAMERADGKISIVGFLEADRVVIDVADNGKGIDRRNFRNVFRPGYSSKKRGWGLGLSLARRIVEDYHGGRIRLLQSRTGTDSGTTFRIELDAAGR